MIDTFPRFLAFWSGAESLPLDAQIDAWQHGYLAPWPELFEKQRDDYAAQGVDWRDVARERVFPFLARRLPDITAAHDGLLRIIPATVERVEDALCVTCNVQFVIHVGNGNGAGWVTTFGGAPAVLFGLENIAECGWTDDESLQGLAVHELGHAVHFAWRREAGLTTPADNPWWWQLYEEGFAQYVEDVVAGGGHWHEAGDSDSDWLAWCRAQQSRLAGMFLNDVDRGEPLRRFFGSWYDIDGHSQCGYFLGYAMIRAWAQAQPLHDVACLPAVVLEERARAALEAMARTSLQDAGRHQDFSERDIQE